MSTITIRTPERACEVAWFSALCGDDYEFLGVPDGRLRSSYAHCRDIVRSADALGYGNILLPSSWIPGQDALAFAALVGPQTARINLLVALRMGEVWPPMLARSGCGSAIVGDPEQVLATLERYMDLGIRAFILSGYPHLDECDLFARHVLPRLPTCRLNEVQGRRVRDPVTPLTTAPRT